MISNKNLKKIKFGILLGCLCYFLLISQINIPFSSEKKLENHIESDVKVSLDPIHNLTGTPIYIDNTDPANDWATFQATYAWCTGDGSAFQPYTISQVLIDGPYTNLFTIKNSDVNFTVTWCDILGGHGIFLDNVTNGVLQYNNCSGGSNGISLRDSQDNLISNNDVRDNYFKGIYLTDSSYNEINSNNILGCQRGMQIEDSFNNTIENNIISASTLYGIELYGGSYNNITRNTIDDTEERAIYCDDSNYNYIAHNEISDARYGVYSYATSEYNTIYNNSIHDMYEWNSCGVYVHGDYHNVSENNIYHCNEAGIKVNGDFNDIFDNTIDTTNESGIIMEFCSNFDVRDNIITNVPEFGIDLIGSESGDVFSNLLSNCGFNVDGYPPFLMGLNLDDTNQVNSKPVYFYNEISGLNNGDIINAGQIILYSCDNIDFSNLNLNHCTIGIALYNCESTTISDSEFSYNSHNGMKVIASNYTIITNINALNNGNGIFVKECDEINITETTLSHNLYGIFVEDDEYSIQDTKGWIGNNIIIYNMHSGISLKAGDHFQIKDNQIERNGAPGIYLYWSHFNNISSNTVKYNVVAGIYLDVSSNNSISDNTASFNTDFGIKLSQYSNDNNITKNTLTSNYNTTASHDWSSKGLEIYPYCADNFVSENTIRNHREAINIELSDNITIHNNVLEDGANFQRVINITFSENLVTAPPMEANTHVYLSHASGCTFIDNILNWVGFRISYNSDYNSFIGNVLSDPSTAFAFEDSSYNKVINNSIYRAGQCFRETGTCIGNVFEGNYCQEGIDLPLDIFGALIGSIAVAGVAVFMYLKRRKYMR